MYSSSIMPLQVSDVAPLPTPQAKAPLTKKNGNGGKHRRNDGDSESDANDDGEDTGVSSLARPSTILLMLTFLQTKWTAGDKLTAMRYLLDPETYDFQRHHQRIAYDKVC